MKAKSGESWKIWQQHAGTNSPREGNVLSTVGETDCVSGRGAMIVCITRQMYIAGSNTTSCDLRLQLITVSCLKKLSLTILKVLKTFNMCSQENWRLFKIWPKYPVLSQASDMREYRDIRWLYIHAGESLEFRDGWSVSVTVAKGKTELQSSLIDLF